MSTQATAPVKQPVKITRAGSGVDDIFQTFNELTRQIAKKGL